MSLFERPVSLAKTSFRYRREISALQLQRNHLTTCCSSFLPSIGQQRLARQGPRPSHPNQYRFSKRDYKVCPSGIERKTLWVLYAHSRLCLHTC
jgi:hypothetical protein